MLRSDLGDFDFAKLGHKKKKACYCHSFVL